MASPRRMRFMIGLSLLFDLSGPLLRSQSLFNARCGPCHGEDARGTAQGPGLAMNQRVAEQSEEQLRAYLKRGNPASGMPSFSDLPADDMTTLVKFVRRLNKDTFAGPVI